MDTKTETRNPESRPKAAEPARPSSTEQLRAQSATVAEDIRQLGRLGREVAQEKFDDARRAAGEVLGQGKRKAGDLEDQLVNYVREKPMKSLLIATGVGLLLGMLWSRK